MLITPGAAPPMLTQQSRTARPMVALARQPGPNTPAPELMSSLARIGPFTITSGATASVVPETPSRQKRSSHIASTARYSGRQPAITALTATFWTVARPNRGGTSAITSSDGRPTAAIAAITRPAVGGTTGSPSVTPRANRASMGSTSGPAMPGRPPGLAGAGEGRAVLEPLADLVQQALHRERLGHEGVDRDQDARVADDLGGPARHEDGLDVRVEGEEPVAELLVVDARHHDVGQDHVDGAGVLLRDPEGTLPVLGLQDPISRADQDVTGQVPHLGLIVHHQDRLHPSSILPPGAPLSRTRRLQPPDPSAGSARSP